MYIVYTLEYYIYHLHFPKICKTKLPLVVYESLLSPS